MSLFFKDSLSSKLINEYGLEKDLVKRRFQLLGYKLFKKCASGQYVDEKDLVKRVIYLNKTKNLGFVVKDLIKGCELSEKPSDNKATQEATFKLLKSLEGYSEEELEKLDIIEEAYVQDKLPISRDVLEYGIKSFMSKQFELKPSKTRSGEDVLILVNKLNNKPVITFYQGLSEEVAKEFMQDVADYLNMNIIEFYLYQSDYVKLDFGWNQSYQIPFENNLKLIFSYPKKSRNNLKITAADVLADVSRSGLDESGAPIVGRPTSVRKIYQQLFRYLTSNFSTIWKKWLNDGWEQVL